MGAYEGELDMEQFDRIKDLVLKFSKDRNWDQFHNPKDLALSLSLEASELLECFQWKESDIAVKKNRDNMIKELADIVVYCIFLSDKLEVDLLEAVENKMQENALKYPVELSYGRAEKYTELGLNKNIYENNSRKSGE